MGQLVIGLVTAGLWIAGIWKVFQGLGRPHSRGIRLLAAFYLGLALTTTVWALPRVVDDLMEPILGPGSSALLRNVVPVAALYAAIMFLISSAGDMSARRVFWRLRFPAVIMLGITVPAWFLTPLEYRGGPLTDVTSTGHVVFFGVTLIGLAYFTTFVGAPITYRLAGRAPDRVTQVSLYIAATGFLVPLPLFLGPRLVALTISLVGFTPSSNFERLGMVGQFLMLSLFVVGFGGPVLRAKLVAARLWFRHLILTRQMYPLWSAVGALTTSYQLLREKNSSVPLRGVHHRFYRRVVECRDGLVLMARLIERPSTSLSVHEEARLLLSMLGKTAAVSTPAAPAAPGWVIGAPTGSTVEDDAAALAALAAAMRAHQTQRGPREHESSTSGA